MKLILCLKCQDVYKLERNKLRQCSCQLTWGYYLSDGLNAEVSDNESTSVLGFHNGTLSEAVFLQRRTGDRPDGMGHRFTAFIIPDCAPTVKRVKEPRK